MTNAITLDTLKANELRTNKEKNYWALLFVLMLQMAFAILLLFPLVLLLAFLAYCVQELFLAYVRGNGVKVTSAQFPELHARIARASQRLGVDTPPEAYIVQAGGSLNALATRLFSRNFIIIFSELIEACGPDDKTLDFVIGHELGHIAFGHLKWATWFLPMRFMPLLPQAWSRACEYSCDRAGLVVAGDLAASERGLAILAAGRTMAARMSVAAWSAQAVDETQRFWAHIWELNASHPYLTKRVRALREFCAPGTEPPVQRRILAIFLAPLLGQPVTAVVLVIYFGIFGLSAGIAAVSATNKRGAAAEAQALLSACRDAQTAFFAANGKWATRFDELKLDVDTPEKYTLYMGENALGPEQSVPVELRGYAVADGGFACVAVRNADSDDTWDVWIIDDNLTKPHHYVDDATEAVVDWRPQQPEAATDDTDDE